MKATAGYIRSVIGKPYRPGGVGPDAFDCFGLARDAMAALFGRELPLSVSHAARSGWRRVLLGCDGAVVLMGAGGQDKHIGVYVARGVLHAVEGYGVIHDDVPTLRLRGFSRLRFYVAT